MLILLGASGDLLGECSHGYIAFGRFRGFNPEHRLERVDLVDRLVRFHLVDRVRGLGPVHRVRGLDRLGAERRLGGERRLGPVRAFGLVGAGLA
jgi:hypothetical protein